MPPYRACLLPAAADIHLFLNGSSVNAIQLDTTRTASDTLDYVVTDAAGLTATSTRTVVIEAAQSPSIVPDNSATTTATTTTR